MGDDFPDGVSRETVMVAAEEVFGAQLPTARRYADLLADAGVVRGLIGPREVPRLWERHLINCAVAAARLPAGSQVADVGSGAGLPGLVWAVARPDVELTLIEPLLRRTTFLTEAVQTLSLENVQVVRSRVEDIREQYDFVTARAVAPLEKLIRWCLPVTTSGGWLLAMKGRSAAEEAQTVEKSLTAMGGRSMVVKTYGDDVVSRGIGLSEPTRLVEIQKR